jgi:predicted type IV restriction endonuclease
VDTYLQITGENVMSAEAKLNPVQEAIEKARVEVLKCTSPEELKKFLADLEERTKELAKPEHRAKMTITENDAYGFLLQALVVDNFDGLDRKGQSYWVEGTWEKFAELWLVAIHGR